MKGLADFTLIIQNIARVNSNSPSLFNWPPVYLPVRIQTPDSPVYENPKDPLKSRQIRLTASVFVDESGRFVPDSPYYPVRVENLGTDAALKSSLSATVTIPH